MRPETRTRCVQRNVGQWVTQTSCIPGPRIPKIVCGPCGPQVCMTQCPPRQVCRRVWCPRVVQEQIPYTVMVPQVVRQSCPVQVTRYVPEVVVKKVPVTVTRMVTKEMVQSIPYRVCRMECETKTQQIPYQVCKMVSEQRTREIPYSVCKMVSETRTRKVPYCVTRQVPYTTTRRVCKVVPREVQTTCTRMVGRQVMRQVPYTRSVLIPETVCCTSTCAPGATGVMNGCATGNCAGVSVDANMPVVPQPDSNF